MSNVSDYTIGQCKSCGKTTALKDGRCIDCKVESFELPKEFESIFGKGFDGKL